MKRETLEKVHSASKNLIVSGALSTGKTANVLFPLVEVMIEKNESLMFLDSKEEYINKYYNQLKDKNYNLVVLNLRELDKSDGWNPLECAYNLYKKGDHDKALDYLDKLAKTMFYESTANDPFWSNVAADFFTGVVLALFEDGTKEEINLGSVNLMFEGTNEKFGVSDYITEYFKTKSPSSKAYVSASTTFLAPKETKGGILSTAKQKMRTYVSREKLNVLMDKTTFDYEDISKKPTAVFVIAKDESKYLNTVAAMFIEQLFSILVDLKTNNKFNFVLDNFDNIERINEFTDMLGSGISRNIKFVVGTRSFEDLLTNYSSYITKLSNRISISSDKIEVVINDIKEVIDNDFEKVEFDFENIEYPMLSKTEIKLFDLKKYVNDKKKEYLEREMKNPTLKPFKNPFPDTNNTSDVSVDALIKRIDDKLAELEAEEQLCKIEQRDIQVESELLQFKLDENEETNNEVIKEDKVATRKSWKIEPMPEENKEVKLNISLNDEEIKQLKKGHKPEAMEDHWFMFYEDGKLYLHRSWSGYCIFIVEIPEDGKITKAIVNRNKEQCTNTSDEWAIHQMELLIYYLVGRNEETKETFEKTNNE